MKRNTILAFTLSLCLAVGLAPSLVANAAVRKDATVKVESKIKEEQKKDTTTALDLGKISTPLNGDMIKESKISTGDWNVWNDSDVYNVTFKVTGTNVCFRSQPDINSGSILLQLQPNQTIRAIGRIHMYNTGAYTGYIYGYAENGWGGCISEQYLSRK